MSELIVPREIVAPKTFPWGWTYENSLIACNNSLQWLATLAHLDWKKRLCVCSDISVFSWSELVTHIPIRDRPQPFVHQQHEPISLLFGHSQNGGMRWSTLEREAYAIMATVERMHWMIANSRGFDLFTVQNNLVLIWLNACCCRHFADYNMQDSALDGAS